MKLRDLIARIGLAETARRLHRSESTVRKWKGRPPKTALVEVTKVIRRHEVAKKVAVKKKRERARKGKRLVQAERELKRARAQLAEEKFRQMNYWDRLEYERQRHVEGLVPYRTIKKIATQYGIPTRQVWRDYVSPKLHATRRAA